MTKEEIDAALAAQAVAMREKQDAEAEALYAAEWEAAQQRADDARALRRLYAERLKKQG